MTEQDLKEILTPEVIKALSESAKFHVEIYGGDFNTVLRDLAVEWVVQVINNR